MGHLAQGEEKTPAKPLPRYSMPQWGHIERTLEILIQGPSLPKYPTRCRQRQCRILLQSQMHIAGSPSRKARARKKIRKNTPICRQRTAICNEKIPSRKGAVSTALMHNGNQRRNGKHAQSHHRQEKFKPGQAFKILKYTAKNLMDGQKTQRGIDGFRTPVRIEVRHRMVGVLGHREFAQFCDYGKDRIG